MGKRGPPSRVHVGDRFGRLIVQAEADVRKGSLYWQCICDCGTVCIKRGANLIGGTASCGCLSLETHTKHGGSPRGRAPHLLYYTWKGLRQRCNDPNQRAYDNYGGRGIYVDSSWDDFAQFASDMGDPPTSNHTIDRIDNDGP